MEFSEDDKMIWEMFRKLVRSRLMPLENALLSGAKTAADVAAEVGASMDEMGVAAMNVPERFGGGGITLTAGCLAAFELGRTFIPVPLGDVPPMLFECTPEQRKKYLDPVVGGGVSVEAAFRDLPGGSPARAALEGGSYVLNGDKAIPPHAEPAGLYLVFARTGADPAPASVSCFVLPGDAEGLSAGGGALRLRSCRAGADALIGIPGGAFSLGREWIPHSRIRKAARQVGTAERLVEISAAYARDWLKFGKPLAGLPSVRRALADSAAEVFAARTAVLETAALADSGKPVEKESMMTRLLAHELIDRVAGRSVEIHGGPLPHFRIWTREGPGGGEAMDLLRLGISRGVIKDL